MRKTSLAAAAVLTAGLAQPAFASEPLKVTIGGDVVTGFYVIDADNSGTTSFQDTKVAVVARNIDVVAEGVLDNGLKVGVDAKLALGSDSFQTNPAANNNGSASFRQLFSYVEGNYGRVEIGGTDGAAFKMHFTSPWFVPGNGVDYPNISNAGTTYSPAMPITYSVMATNANKITYFTPRIMGFQLGGSFTPTVVNSLTHANGLGLVSKASLPIRDVREIALNYVGTFGGVDFGADGFYTMGTSNLSSNEPKEYGAGTNIAFQGFTLGGAWAKAKDLDSTLTGKPIAREDRTTWTAGLSYATGPWTVGLAYLHSSVTSPNYIGSFDGRKSSTLQTGGGYELGSGVKLGLDLLYEKNKQFSGAPTLTSKSAGLVLDIGF